MAKYVRAMALKCHEIDTCFSRTACSEICNKRLHIEHVGFGQEGFRTSFRENASGCVGSKPRFYYPMGQLEPGMLEANFQHWHILVAHPRGYATGCIGSKQLFNRTPGQACTSMHNVHGQPSATTILTICLFGWALVSLLYGKEVI